MTDPLVRVEVVVEAEEEADIAEVVEAEAPEMDAAGVTIETVVVAAVATDKIHMAETTHTLAAQTAEVKVVEAVVTPRVVEAEVTPRVAVAEVKAVVTPRVVVVAEVKAAEVAAEVKAVVEVADTVADMALVAEIKVRGDGRVHTHRYL